MNKLKISAWLLLGFCISASVVRAQEEKPPLFDGVERVFREKEPRWKIEQLNVKGRLDPLEQDIVFRAGRQQAAVHIVVWKNVKDASDTFQATLIAKGNTSKRKRRHRLPGFGDEGYIWLHPGSNAWPTIDFRQGGVTVSVFAPSTAIAKRFAGHILAQISSDQK